MITLNQYLSVANAFVKLHNETNITQLIVEQTNFYFNFKRTPGFVHDWLKQNKVSFGKYRIPENVYQIELPEEIDTEYGCNIRIQLNKVVNNKAMIVFLNNEQRSVDKKIATKVLAILDAIKPELRLEVQNFCIQSYNNLMTVAKIKI